MSLKISNLFKTYDNGVTALNDINLEIPNGMFGLLGPNGAGKSSLMRTIATLQDPDQGTITFNDINVLKEKEILRSKLGYLPQEFGVYPKISAEELLDYLASLKGITNANDRKSTVQNLLHLTNLSEHKTKAVATYSGGMKQRFGIAQALIGNPELIIVDEPTAGLDPEERLRFYNILSEVGNHVTVILSTHIVSDVSDLCQNFAIIDQGRVLAQTTPDLAAQIIQGKVWSKLVSKRQAEDLEKTHKVIASKFVSGNQLVKVFSDKNPSADFSEATPQLEDFYFAHVKGYIQ
jgi:ABC-2 type transport system ATP-binding protein